MKFIFIILFIIVSVVMPTSGIGGFSAWQSFGDVDGATPAVTLLESDLNHMVVEVSIPGFRLTKKPGGGRVWDIVELPGCYAQGPEGLPDLPSVTGIFALPFGTEAVVTIEEITSTSYENIDVLPRQTPEIDMDHDPFPFVKDEEFYRGDRAYPETWAGVDYPGTWSGLHVSRLVVTPFRYDPAVKTLEVASKIRLRVDFRGNIEKIADPVTPSLIPSMRRNIMNWDVFEATASPLEGATDDGVEFIFICTENSADWVADLFRMHHFLGLRVKVETLPTPANIRQIKDAITGDYTSGVTRFVCIVGTHDELPSYTWSKADYVGDYWYGCMDDDIYAELAVGRLTGNRRQIKHQVTKIIDGYCNYSDFDNVNTADIIPSEAILAAHGEQYPKKYTKCMNELAAYEYSLIDFTFNKIYPPEGGTAEMLSDGINNKIGTVTYRGHGNVTKWTWSPGWNEDKINALTNTFMPLVFNIACLCGSYTDNSTCLAEAWQWADGGAGGNVAATAPSYTEPNHDYIKEIFKEIYDNGNYRISEALNAALVTIIGIHGIYGEANAKMYIWFGDPAMDVWTFDQAGEPRVLVMDHPTSFYPGNQDVTVTVTADGAPVEGVDVTVTDGVDGYDGGMTIYEEGTTDASGRVTFNVTIPSEGATVNFGAFKHDYIYDRDYVIVGSGISADGSSPPAFSLDTPYPNPVSDKASIGFSVPSTEHVVISLYDVTGRVVETLLDGSVEAGGHIFTWIPDSDMAGGVYFVRLSSKDGTLTRQTIIMH